VKLFSTYRIYRLDEADDPITRKQISIK